MKSLPTKKQIAQKLFEEAKAAHAEARAELVAKITAAKEKVAQVIISMVKEGKLTVNHFEIGQTFMQSVDVSVDFGNQSPLREAYDELDALPQPRRFDESAARRKIADHLDAESIQELRAFFNMSQTKKKLRKIINA